MKVGLVENNSLEKKIQQAIRLIQSAAKRHGVLEVAYSGGKDSDVILELVKMADVPYKARYKNTTIDPPGTIVYVRSKGVEILKPKQTFFSIVRESGLSRRDRRACCRILKEYRTDIDAVVTGVRKEESKRRKMLYNEPVMCRIGGVEILPLLEWTQADLESFIKMRGLEIHPLYKEGEGYDLSRRLGCLTCPLKYYKARLLDFAKYPKMAAAYEQACADYKKTHPNFESELSAKQWFVCDIFAGMCPFAEAVKNKEKLCDIFDKIISGEISPDMIKRRDFRKKFLNFIKINKKKL